MELEKPQLLWPEFVKLVCQRFSTAGYENIVGQFNKLTQKGKVEEYITQFDELKYYVMAQEGFHREYYYVDNFVSGLKEEISQYLYNQKPKSMQEARDLARGQEHFLTVLDKRYKSQPNSANFSSSYQKNPTLSKGIHDNTTQITPAKSPSEGFKRLTMAELTERKQKGLCFYCDQKYEPDHRCQKKKLFVLLGDETIEDLKEEELASIWEDSCPETERTEDAKVSLNAMTGSKRACTMKI